MSELKCPFCNQELRKISATSFFVCDSCNITGFDKLWQELIRTCKALNVARNGLEYVFGYEDVPKYVVKHISQVLDQIKSALEQKDNGGNK